jgi:hypothetical protein
VPGAFMFWNVDLGGLTGKAQAAFRAGFLGVRSLGWSTLVQIVDASEDDREAMIEQLALHLRERFGAPDAQRARAAAVEEVAFAASLCEPPRDTLIALHRGQEDGAIREAFRTLRPREGAKPLRAFSLVEVEGEDAPGETVDLTRLMGGERP